MFTIVKDPQKGEKVTAGCLILFCLPCITLGLILSFLGISQLVSPSTDIPGAIILIIFGTILEVLGIGVIIGVRYNRRYQARKRLMQSRNPDKPWLWREDWASGKVNSSRQKNAIGLWILAIFWNAISWVALIALVSEGIEYNTVPLFLAVLFAIIGFFILVSAIHDTIRLKKYGVSTFEMTTIPGVIGDRIEGIVYARLSQTPPKGVTVILRCINRVTTGSGKNRSTHEHIFWQEQKIVERGYISRGYKASAIPVSFPIPLDVEETDTSNSNDMILWRLEANAETPGIDYKAVFEIPVFRTEKTRSLEKKSAGETTEDELTAYQAPAETLITIKSTRRGGWEFYFPPARNTNAAIGLTAFLLIWSGATFCVIRFGAPIIFPLIFSAVGFIILLITLNIWTASSRIIIEGGDVIIRKALMGISVRKAVPCSEVLDVTIKRGMSSGNKVYYDIALVTLSGKRILVASMINDRKYALWLAGKMKHYIHQ